MGEYKTTLNENKFSGEGGENSDIVKFNIASLQFIDNDSR